LTRFGGTLASVPDKNLRVFVLRRGEDNNLRSALTTGVAPPAVCTAAAALVLAAGQAVAAIVNAGLAWLVPPPPFPVPA